MIANNEFSHFGLGAGVLVGGRVICPGPAGGQLPRVPGGSDCPDPPATECNWVRPEGAGRGSDRAKPLPQWIRDVRGRDRRLGVCDGAGKRLDGIRHHITSSGHAYSGYVAASSYALEPAAAALLGWRTSITRRTSTSMGPPQSSTPGKHDGGWAGEYHEMRLQHDPRRAGLQHHLHRENEARLRAPRQDLGRVPLPPQRPGPRRPVRGVERQGLIRRAARRELAEAEPTPRPQRVRQGLLKGDRRGGLRPRRHRRPLPRQSAPRGSIRAAGSCRGGSCAPRTSESGTSRSPT